MQKIVIHIHLLMTKWLTWFWWQIFVMSVTDSQCDKCNDFGMTYLYVLRWGIQKIVDYHDIKWKYIKMVHLKKKYEWAILKSVYKWSISVTVVLVSFKSRTGPHGQTSSIRPAVQLCPLVRSILLSKPVNEEAWYSQAFTLSWPT